MKCAWQFFVILWDGENVTISKVKWLSDLGSKGHGLNHLVYTNICCCVSSFFFFHILQNVVTIFAILTCQKIGFIQKPPEKR